MAFILTDVYDSKALGKAGSTVVGSQRYLYINDVDSTVTNYKLTDTASNWKRIYLLDSFNGTNKTNKIEIYDNGNLVETLQGKTTSELKITQLYRGYLNSIAKFNGKKFWLAEAYTDARDPKEADGSIKFFEYRLVYATISSMNEEKSDAEAPTKIVLDGSYDTTTDKRIFRGITPTGGVTLTFTGGNTAVSGTPKTATVTATDFSGANVDYTSLISNTLMGEITSITIVKKSGVPTIAVSPGADDKTKSVTFTTAGSCVVYAQIVTNNGGTYNSADVTVTVS